MAKDLPRRTDRHGTMPNTTEIPVRWSDTDAAGLIYYPQFFHFVVVGVNDYFAPAVETGHLMEHLRQRGRALPTVEASASFAAPLRAGDVALLETTVTAVGESSLTVTFEVTRAEDGEHVAGGEATFVLVDGEFEAVPIPDELRACIRERGDT